MASQNSYHIEVRHDGLHKYRVIRSSDRAVVEQLAQYQLRAWDEMWKKRLAAEEQKRQRDTAALEREAKKAIATEQTREAQSILRELDETLLRTLSVDDRIDWQTLKDYKPFPTARPSPPPLLELPQEPKPGDARYRAQFTLIERLIASKRERRVAETKERFRHDREQWQRKVEEIQRENRRRHEEYKRALAEWERSRQAFLKEQQQRNDAIDTRRRQYEAKHPEAIVDYCSLVLSNSHYPDFFPQEFEMDYNPNSKLLVVEYALPAPGQIPTDKEIKYIQSQDKFVKVKASASEANDRYDSLLYQVCLRTIHELFEADVVDALEGAVFNGWVRSTDPATGLEKNACILSVQCGKVEFSHIDLRKVNPKSCFKALKGVGSAALHMLTAVASVATFDKADRRFVSSREVAEGLDETVNLAAMDWEDFEHLIREVFEQEFTSTGGEVKVTRASRDRGVDAVAFDPDPIRGGKIIIQAKRYTNVVDVSAVRDLYGTVLNEGATKGILVTTADYGADAYEFARGKPLTLLNGSNLLHLIEKHGHKAKIDLREAKEVLTRKETV
ncbi:MAG: restriction endonuclease [Armatimonadetes bacterium]|nr:restriction endonuclease [Armatimonadota bacterium]